MSAIKWTSFLTYKAKHSDIDSVLQASFVPVSLFSVEGGARRIIDLKSTDEISMVSEFEQARSFKNIRFYLPPTQNFEWLDLSEAAIHKLSVSIAFRAFGDIGKKTVQSIILLCKNAKINEIPNKKWNPAAKNNSLVVRFALPETRLIYGSLQDNELVEEDW